MSRDGDFPEVVILPTRSKTLANIFGSAMFAVAAVFFIMTPDLYARLIGVTAFIAFTIGAVYSIYRLISNAPVVVVNADGIFDNASPFAVGWMDWTEIEQIHPRRNYLTRLIGIRPHDRYAAFARVPPHRRWMLRTLAVMSHTPINIPATLLGRRLDEVQRMIEGYHDKFGGQP
jgi:hypothetical protein